MCRSLKDASTIEMLPLPLPLKKELRNNVKYYWMHMDNVRAPKFDVNEYPYEDIQFYGMSRDQFNMLMHMPNNFIPYFTNDLFRNDTMHVVTDHHEFRINSRIFCVCDGCYQRLNYIPKDEFKSLWGQEKSLLRYSRTNRCINQVHIRHAVDLLYKAWEVYCDMCVVQPLVDIVTEDDCDHCMELDTSEED